MVLTKEDAESLRRSYLARYLDLHLAFDEGKFDGQELERRVRSFLESLREKMPALRRDILRDPALIKAIYQRQLPDKV